MKVLQGTEWKESKNYVKIGTEFKEAVGYTFDGTSWVREITAWNPDPEEELLNSSFELGTDYWQSNKYNADLTDNGDGSIHVNALAQWGGIEAVYPPLRSANWVLEAVTKNRTGGDIKLAIQKSGGTWMQVVFTSDDPHTLSYNGAIAKIDISTVGADLAEWDIEYISLKEV